MKERFVIGVSLNSFYDSVALLMAEPATARFYWVAPGREDGLASPLAAEEVAAGCVEDVLDVPSVVYLYNADGGSEDTSLWRSGEIASWLLSRCRELAGQEQG